MRLYLSPVAGIGAGQGTQRHRSRHEAEIGVRFAGRDKLVYLIGLGEAPPRLGRGLKVFRHRLVQTLPLTLHGLILACTSDKTGDTTAWRLFPRRHLVPFVSSPCHSERASLVNMVKKVMWRQEFCRVPGLRGDVLHLPFLLPGAGLLQG